MHSAAMLDTMGIFFIILGLVIAKDFDASTIKLILIVIFLWFTSPVSSHLISKLEYVTDETLNNEIENELSETKEDDDDANI
jgi:multicomponent Na+:H+ antiporter subunit G